MFNINFKLIVVDNCFVFVGLLRTGQALSLRYDINFNLNVTDNSPISANLHGGSKPPPYRVPYELRVQFSVKFVLILNFVVKIK